MYTIPAIPTRYNGVNFRSRLEAKWAAFFDLLDGDGTMSLWTSLDGSRTS